MKLFIMGLTACGKSRQAKNLGKHFNLKYISGSQFLLNALQFKDNSTEHFWMESVGKKLDTIRDHSEYDLEVDKQLLQEAEKHNECLVFDSWTLPWLYRGKDAIRIYLNPTIEARAKMAFRSKENKKYDLEKLAELLKQKDESSRKRFIKMYGFDIYDKSSFDLVFDNSLLERDETTAALINYIRKKQDIITNRNGI